MRKYLKSFRAEQPVVFNLREGDKTAGRQGGLQMFGFADGEAPGIKADFGCGGKIVLQPLGETRSFGGAVDGDVRRHFGGGLELIAAVDKQDAAVAEGADQQPAGRAGEAGEGLQPVFFRKDVLPGKHVVAGENVSVEFFSDKDGADFIKFHFVFSITTVHQLSISED